MRTLSVSLPASVWTAEMFNDTEHDVGEEVMRAELTLPLASAP